MKKSELINISPYEWDLLQIDLDAIKEVVKNFQEGDFKKPDLINLRNYLNNIREFNEKLIKEIGVQNYIELTK